jgi:hypothetical protein
MFCASGFIVAGGKIKRVAFGMIGDQIALARMGEKPLVVKLPAARGHNLFSFGADQNARHELNHAPLDSTGFLQRHCCSRKYWAEPLIGTVI